MGVSQWVVTIIGLLLSFGIAWFFWGPKKGGSQAEVKDSGYQEADILVKGGYTPDVIVVHRGKPVRLQFLREDKSSCSEMVVFPDFEKSMMLPFGKKVTVELLPNDAGSYPFTCQMGMYRGTLIVKE
ncbi:cupredoxin domain-containing protein [Effusibacillus lacus]|uniref:Copper-transporting ATPase n=1 Tax=Effusibacillus lacus TaxID=1348429 RepID=A0A292YEI9_9BACL|nr:cupredoxin domain-containing protein [Effusibacillus lacus]TCS74963.1 cupredoxin-like protein [Effusibacillus lacus]GAX91632.1 copper-transporting ATPase [Effusibacillus lacus]